MTAQNINNSTTLKPNIESIVIPTQACINIAYKKKCTQLLVKAFV